MVGQALASWEHGDSHSDSRVTPSGGSQCDTSCEKRQSEPSAGTKPASGLEQSPEVSQSVAPSQCLDDGGGGRKYGCCKHYKSRCEQKASCCDEYFGCRLCHDEAVENDPTVTTHVMDRFTVRSLRCTACKREQLATYTPADVTCAFCKVPFASYACYKCMLFHDGDDRDMYHCDECAICRLGKHSENYHCRSCNACVSKRTKSKKHVCNENSLKGDCPICALTLYASIDPVVFLPCGHALHEKCFRELARHDYRCCLCLKSMTDMSEYFEELNKVVAIELQNMPAEYKDRKVVILCHDCGARSTVPFHFDRWRCTNIIATNDAKLPDRECGSFNTRIL
jgi:RING finger and CHY zinc finger domain-containing protein 1